MDEELQTGNIGDQNIDTLSSGVEPKAQDTEVSEVQPEKTEKSTEEPKVEGARPVSGAEKRIHQLVDERDGLKQEVHTLQSRLEELTAGQGAPQGNTPQYQPLEGASQEQERELTIDDLRTIARLEVEKERTINRINLEASEAQKLYPELDKTSDDFDADISEAVSTAVMLEIQANPGLSVKRLTEKYMKPYRKASEKAVSREKQTLTKQVSEEALRPTNVKGKDKQFHEKSLEEMEAELGFTY